MRRHPRAHRISGLILLLTGVLIAGQGLVSASPATAAPPGASPLARAAALAGGPAATVSPRSTGELDCNGLSPIQHPARPGMMCEDPRGGHRGRFYENGHYIGHDEPSVRYLSGQRGSGADITFNERLPRDPAAPPTVSRPGHDITHWFELSIAPWFSTDVCDPYSTRCCTAGRSRTATRRAAGTRAAARRSSSCSSTRRDSPPSPTPSAATTPTGARR